MSNPIDRYVIEIEFGETTRLLTEPHEIKSLITTHIESLLACFTHGSKPKVEVSVFGLWKCTRCRWVGLDGEKLAVLDEKLAREMPRLEAHNLACPKCGCLSFYEMKRE